MQYSEETLNFAENTYAMDSTIHDKYTYPFWELGWNVDAMIHPVIYTLSDWKNKKPVFRSNVEKDGIRIC